eukprot:gene13437-18016_t
MPKHEPMTAKAISNRQKSIGLQRLKWYCQMCQKQCRDENGFKCHTASEGHLRQMRVFAENPHNILDEFSREFERGYLEILSHRHGTKRVLANKVYQEYIADKQHIHMNATRWTTLTGLCMHLGREGKAVVDETEKGWYIQFIDRDPKLLARQLQSQQRQQHELDEEDRKNLLIESQIKAAEEAAMFVNNDEVDEVNIDEIRDSQGKIGVTLSTSTHANLNSRKRMRVASIFTNDDDNNEAQGDDDDDQNEDSDLKKDKKISNNTTNNHKNLFIPSSFPNKKQQLLHPNDNNHNHIKEDNFQTNSNNNQISNKDYQNSTYTNNDKPNSCWIKEGIIVKVINKNIYDGKIYNMKGEIRRVRGSYEADVDIDGHRYLVDQRDLQTVVPKVGGTCLIVRGRGKGSLATILSINTEQYTCDLRLQEDNRIDGLRRGDVLNNVEYEDFSKYYN